MGGRVIIKKNWNVDKEMENMDKEIKQRLDHQFDFIREIDKEKFIGRQTYLTGAERKENDSEHAWHMAIMTLLLSEYANKEIDVLHTISMLLIHDLVEIDAGDTYAYDEEGKKTQAERERKAAENRERNCMICGSNLRRRRRQKRSSQGRWTIYSR